ncbi:MAG TPA: hypothetical protein EYN91_19285, partial [Candidatus Melainabacteria bacterium]|nr:hypothetical protein [Candidatus Melainabacteria bacterium]
MITSKSKTALSVCLAISVSLIATYQPADSKSKTARNRSSSNVQIAALPFFRKEGDKNTDAKKKPADKAPAADARSVGAYAEVIEAVAEQLMAAKRPLIIA